jgi:excisionase family DNA binding protein
VNAKEVARYLDVHEKQVYLLIKAGEIPCTKITGKWIFPVNTGSVNGLKALHAGLTDGCPVKSLAPGDWRIT